MCETSLESEMSDSSRSMSKSVDLQLDSTVKLSCHFYNILYELLQILKVMGSHPEKSGFRVVILTLTA